MGQHLHCACAWHSGCYMSSALTLMTPCCTPAPGLYPAHQQHGWSYQAVAHLSQCMAQVCDCKMCKKRSCVIQERQHL